MLIFDHSNGYDRMSDGTLTISGVEKNFGGNQHFMRDSCFEDSSYLGPYNHPQKLKVDDTQKMCFTDLDIGPFCMSENQRDGRQFDVVIGTKQETLIIPGLMY